MRDPDGSLYLLSSGRWTEGTMEELVHEHETQLEIDRRLADLWRLVRDAEQRGVRATDGLHAAMLDLLFSDPTVRARLLRDVLASALSSPPPALPERTWRPLVRLITEVLLGPHADELERDPRPITGLHSYRAERAPWRADRDAEHERTHADGQPERQGSQSADEPPTNAYTREKRGHGYPSHHSPT